MYPVTNAVKALYAAEQRQFLRITGTDRNGVAINITDANVVFGSFNIDRYSCNGNRLEVGTAIAAEMTVKLDNHAGTYNGIVFEGAELYVEIGIGDPVNWMPCGYFTPDEQPRTANQITIHALDRMVKFDNSVPGLVPWTTGTGESMTDWANQPIYFMTDLVIYPTTIQTIIQTICGYYNIPFTQNITSLPNYNYTISEAPNLQQPTTYRNVIQWCAGIMGTCAWIDWTGSLRFSWYGATTGYVSTPANRFSSDLHEDNVEITGIQYTNLQNYTALAGRPEYTIDMTGNYLMAGNVTQILTTVNNRLNGYTYRPFSATIINAPYLWPMDQITFTDKNGNNHTCILTNVNFGINGAMSIEGKGESMQAASRDALSGMTKEQGVLVEQAREATQQLNDSLTQEEIFNRLTDNGAEQGLILYNGKLYLNASYVQTGTLSADRIGANSISVGKLTGTISNDDWVLDLTNGTLTIGNISAGNITSGTLSADRIGANSISVGKLTGTISNDDWVLDLTNGTLTIGDISASNISGGTLTLGGHNNINGSLELLDDGNNNIGIWDYNGATIRRGTIKNYSTDGNNYASLADSSFQMWGNVRPVASSIAEWRMIASMHNYMPSGGSIADCMMQLNSTANILVGALSNEFQPKITLYARGGVSPADYTSQILIDTNQGIYLQTYDNVGNDAGILITKNFGTTVYGNFAVTGTKNRIVSTDQYSDRLLYCYETPSPLFGDVGEGKIGEDGKCYIWLDPIFAQTISTNQYQVFLQRYGDGECYVSERKGTCFIVTGTPGMAFGWEIKAKQKDFDQRRLDRNDEPFTIQQSTYGADAAQYITNLRKERESA